VAACTMSLRVDAICVCACLCMRVRLTIEWRVWGLHHVYDVEFLHRSQGATGYADGIASVSDMMNMFL